MSEQDLRETEKRMVAEDIHNRTWRMEYEHAYTHLPEQMCGSLLKEAVDSLSQGDEIDDLIIAAYDNGNTETVGFLVSLLLDRYRDRAAKRAADAATGE